MHSKLFLKKNEERRIKAGHLWIFSNEVEKIEGSPENGDLAKVFDSRNNFIAAGFYNKNSLICLRILSLTQEFDLEKLFRERLSNAHNLRKEFYANRNSFRMIFSESDFLPGLIIDKYNDTYVLQIYSFGMQKNVGIIIEILKEDFYAKNIFTKNENYFRRLEGLSENDEIYFGKKETEIIDDGFIKYKIDFDKSQKTGFYFDQNDNRKKLP